MMEAGELPVGWVATSLSEIASKLVDGSHNPPAKQASGLPMLSAVNINDNKILFSDFRLITEADFEQEDRRTKVVAGDVLLTIVGAIGRTAVVPEAIGKFTLQRSVAVITPVLVSSKFLMYQIEAPRVAQYFKDNARGTAQKGVYLKTLGATEIWLPPLPEQHRIVAKIEELFSELDQGVASLKTAREQLKVYRQSLLKNAFEGKLTAAIGWREKPLGQLLGFLTSGSRGWAAYYATSGDLFVRAQNIKYDRLELDDVAFVALPDKAEGLRTRVQQGDLLITITGANVTKSALVKHDLGVAYVSQHVALCRPTTEILPEYLYWFIVAEAAGRKQLTDMAYGAGKPGLNLENIRSVNVPFPSVREQHEIVEQIESKLSEADQLDQTLATALQQADALRQSILKKAFCGQLVKQDKNDEPATALLERIRAERSSLSTTRRSRRAIPEAPKALELTPPPGKIIPFPVAVPGIAAKDLHAGILAMAYRLHELHPDKLPHFGHVKAEKISHLVEAHLGLDLERQPFKDAAGPNDHPHLKKVEHRARKANWFEVTRLETGRYEFRPQSGFGRLLTKTQQALGGRLGEVERLLELMLPMNMRQAEILATVYAAWNNLLLLGKSPSDEEIVLEARENWHESKLKIDRSKFFRAVEWMREKGLVPVGRGRLVVAKGE